LPPVDEAFLTALAAGLPDCAGVAVGIDRLVALATNQSSVAATLSFAHTHDD
jgi:lysyl-tRNA synthetase class 2